MRTAIYVGTSLDGFIARENGDLDWLVPFESPEVAAGFKRFMSGVDAVVMGSGTYEKVLSFDDWPYDKHVFVLSSRLKEVPEKVLGKVTFLSMKPRQVLAALAERGLASLYIDGGKVIQNFLKEDLIDQMTITKVPVLIGEGIPLFGKLPNDLLFQHKETRVHSQGLVESRYERDRSVPPVSH